jgi:hypothetical protein
LFFFVRFLTRAGVFGLVRGFALRLVGGMAAPFARARATPALRGGACGGILEAWRSTRVLPPPHGRLVRDPDASAARSATRS